MLSLCVLAFLVTYFARLAISPVVPLIADDFAVSNTAVGVALAALVGAPVFLLFAWRVRPTEPRRPDQPMRKQFALTPLVELPSRLSVLLPLFVAMTGTYVVRA